MGKHLRDEFPPFANILQEAGSVLEFDLQSLIFDGTMEEITRSENAQPALVATSYGFFQYYMSTIGIEPDYLAGHSLGEISALLCSGAFSLRDAISFVRMRGELMQRAYEDRIGHMGLVMGLETERLALELADLGAGENYVAIASYNSPKQTLVSGNRKGIRALSGRMEDLGAEYVPFRMVAMKVDAPYHCELMDYAQEPIRKHLKKIGLGEMRWPVVANVTARPYQRASDIPELLSNQLTSPVKWMQTLSFLQSEGAQIALEIGPGQVLKNLVVEAGAPFPVLSIDLGQDRAKMEQIFCIGRQALVNKLEACLRWIAGTKNNGLWDEQRFEASVARPYRHIESVLADIEGGSQVSETAICEAVRITVAAIEAKQTSRKHRNSILDDLVPDLLLRNRKFSGLADLVDSKTV